MFSHLPGLRRYGIVLTLLVLGWASSAARAETLTGQVVCSQCWFEADRGEVAYGTPADLDCAARCARDGIGSSLAVRGAEGFELFALLGPPPGGGSWLDWTGRFVRIDGRVDTRSSNEDKVGTTLRPATIEALAENPWPRPDAVEGDVELSWTDLRGRPIGLQQRSDRIVVINFWATWCRPCLKEMPDLVRLHDKFAPFGVEFLAASADDPQHVETVLEYARKKRINFPVALGATTAQMERLGLPPTLPGTVILDEEGRPAERFAGVIDPDLVDARLSAMLGLAGEPTSRTATESTEAAETVATRTQRHGHGDHASLVPS